MFKKLLIIALVGGVAVFALRHTRAFSYAKDEISAAGDWLDSKVPVDKKIKQLRKEIANLDKEIDKCSDELAREIVEHDHLSTDIGREMVAIQNEEKKVRAAGEAIKTVAERANNNGGTTTLTYGRHTVSVDEAKQLLADDVKRLKSRQTTLNTMQETLVARERVKDALTSQVEGIKRQKRELAVAVDHLEADYKRLQLQQIESKYQFDDSKLARVKEQMQNLQKEIEIKRTKLKIAPTIASEGGAPANNLSVDDILSPLDGAAKKAAKPSN